MSITRILQPIRPALLGYSVAVLAVAIALGIKLLLDPLFEVESPFLLFFAAIMTSALYGGRGAGIFATVLAVLISNYLFLSPTYSLFNHNLGQNLRLLLFVLEGLLISGTISALTSVRQRITFGQQALSDSEERYRLVIESAQDYAIFILDPDGCIASWNIGAQNLKGYRADEIIGQHFSRFYPEEDIHRSKPNQLLKVATTVGRVEDEGWRVRQDGSRFWANVVITALRDEEGNLRGFSKVTRDITKIERPFWEARWWTISQETQNQLRETIAQAASGEFVRYEVDVLGAGNTVATIDFSIKPVRDEAGQVVLLIPEGRDITTLKQAEQTLRSFFDSASMMMGIVELVDNDILHISDNAATAKFFGLNPEQMRNRLASDMGASHEYIQQWLRYYREAERTQAPVRFDYAHMTAKGQRWLSATVSLIASFHNHPRFSYVIQDITERKEAEAQIRQLNAELEQRVIERTAQLEATNYQLENEIAERKQIEEALRQSEERFRQAVVNAPFPMAIHAEDGEILQINRTWMELTGYTQQEIPTIADWTEKAYGERQEIVLEVLDRIYELKDKISEGEFTITTKQSTRRIWDFSSAPLGRLPDGRRMVLSMAADVTERKWAEEQLRTRTRQQEAIATLGQRALSGIDLSTLMDEATSLIAQTLDVEYCNPPSAP